MMMLSLLAGNENRPVGCWAGPEALSLLGGNEIAPGGRNRDMPAGWSLRLQARMGGGPELPAGVSVYACKVRQGNCRLAAREGPRGKGHAGVIRAGSAQPQPASDQGATRAQG